MQSCGFTFELSNYSLFNMHVVQCRTERKKLKENSEKRGALRKIQDFIISKRDQKVHADSYGI